MDEIPEFVEALKSFKTFLEDGGYPTRLVWVFRDDLWKVSLSRILLRQCRGNRNLDLAEKVFFEGRERGLVEIVAVGLSDGSTIATVWYPKYEEEEVQGWSTGLKLAIVTPLPTATRVPSVLWALLGLVPGFRAYQRDAFGIGTKRWAAA